MISNPNLILYACVSKGATILAEFNSQDASLATLASKCLDNAPPLHTTFSHTTRKRTHTFLIHDPFLYFTIYHENLHNSEALCFLTNVKESFDKIISGETANSLEHLNSHRFQGEFNPIFHQLLASQLEVPPSSPPQEMSKHGHSGSLDRPKSLKKKKKKKKRSSVETIGEGKAKDKDRDGLVENKVDVSEDVIVMSREFPSVSMQKNGLFVDAKAKRIWKRHAWVVLSLDLIVCCILFGIWLWVCRGFKCIDG